MLSIRMKRLGRKGHPTYRVVVQDSQQSPSSGKYVALLGSYDPHTKQASLVKDKAEFYLKHGAQPSDRVVALFKTEKISLPKWVKKPSKKEKSLRNPDKLRRNRPAGEAEATKPEAAEQTEEKPEPETEAKVDEPKTEEAKEDNTENKEEPKQDSAEEVKPEAESDQADASEEVKPEEASEETSTEDKS